MTRGSHGSQRARALEGWAGVIDTRVALPAMCSSPPLHSISSRLVSKVCRSSPVSGTRFTDTAVRVDSWKAPTAVSERRGVGVVFMDVIVGGHSRVVHVQQTEIRT